MTGARPANGVVAMRRPTLLDVPPMPSFPASTTIRRARVEDAAALAALLGRAYASERWDAAGAEREMFGDETVKAVLVVETVGRLIATASLQVRSDAPERGLVRWVATEEDRRREGLARALVIAVLALAQQAGRREALLHTESDRLAAIALYLQLGFEPVVTTEVEREVWKQVITSLRADDVAGAGDADRRWGALDDVIGGVPINVRQGRRANMKKTGWSPSGLYFFALLPLVIGSHATAFGAFALYDLAPREVQRSKWFGFVLNELAPALAGVACAAILAALLIRVGRYVPTWRGFLRRTMPWYLFAAMIEVVVIQGQANPDFGLWSQAIIWPRAALVVGVATDALVTWWRSHSAPAVDFHTP